MGIGSIPKLKVLNMKSKLLIGLILTVLIIPAHAGLANLLNSNNPTELVTFMQTHSLFYYAITFFVIGLFLAFTPCVLPMVPILSGVIAKQKTQEAKSHARLAIFYVLGMASSYALAGMLAGYLGSSLQSMLQRPAVIIVFSGLMVVMGLAMLDLFQLKMPASLERFIPQSTSTRRGVWGIFLTGAISTLVVSPCVTAPLIGVLTFISQTGQVMLGGMTLFIMALGMGIPLVIFAAGQGAILPKAGKWMLMVKLVFAYMMFAIAIWLLARVLPISLIQIATIGLILMFVMQLSPYLQSITHKFGKASSYAMVLLVMSLIIGQIKIESHADNQTTQVVKHVSFKPYSEIAQLEQALKKAAAAHKPVFIEYFASWCGDCVAMDKKVFTDPKVIEALAPFERLQVDLSESTPTTAAFKEKFQVYGTPMMQFYDRAGKPMVDFNAAGFMDSQHFIALVNKVKKASDSADL